MCKKIISDVVDQLYFGSQSNFFTSQCFTQISGVFLLGLTVTKLARVVGPHKKPHRVTC